MNCVNKCENGLLHKEHKISKHHFVFRCDCLSGDKHPYAKWKGVDAATYGDVIYVGDGRPLFSPPKILTEQDQGVEEGCIF